MVPAEFARTSPEAIRKFIKVADDNDELQLEQNYINERASAAQLLSIIDLAVVSVILDHSKHHQCAQRIIVT